MLLEKERPWARLALAQVARLILLIAVLNGPFWILSSSTFISRGFISLDSLLVAIVLRRYSRWMTAGVWLSWLMDGIVSSASTYRFASPVELIRSVAFQSDIRWEAFLSWSLVLVVLPFLFSTGLLLKARLQDVRTGLSVSVIVIIAVLDAFNGSSMLSRRDIRFVPFNVAGSAATALANALLNKGRVDSLSPVQLGSGGPQEISDLIAAAGRDNKNVVYVIVESLGIPKSLRLREYLDGTLLKAGVLARYEVQSRPVVAIGGTTAGELRRLCGLEGSFRRVTTEDGKKCLPTILGKQGWDTYGVHGFSRDMFLRYQWWPLIGIRQMEFSEDLFKKYPDRCGAAFRGICDRDAIHEAFDLEGRSHSFSYVLTLNSHLPLDDVPVSPELEEICKISKVDKGVCSLVAHFEATLEAIASEALAAQVAPYVVVVGDHPPPFLNPKSRAQFSIGEVPMYTFSPKREAQAIRVLPIR